MWCDRSVRLRHVDCDAWILLYQFVTFVLNDKSGERKRLDKCVKFPHLVKCSYRVLRCSREIIGKTRYLWILGIRPSGWLDIYIYTEWTYTKKSTKANHECNCVISGSLVPLCEMVDFSCHLVLLVYSSWHLVSEWIPRATSSTRWIPRATSCE